MPGCARAFEARPGYEAEYLRCHDDSRPEMQSRLHQSDFRNDSVFRHGLTLFGSFETNDLEASRAFLAAGPVKAQQGN